MDSTTPKNQDDANTTNQAVSQTAASTTPVPNPPVGAEITPAQPTAAPEDVVPAAEPVAEAPAESDDSAPASPAPSEEATPVAPAAVPAPVKPAHSSNKPMGAIVVAIVIALLLAGLSIFAYIKTKNAVQPIDDVNRSSGKAATPQDADKTGEEMDKSLDTVDSLNLGSDLSENTIGL